MLTDTQDAYGYLLSDLTEQRGELNATLTQPIHRRMSQFYLNVRIPDYHSVGRRGAGELFLRGYFPRNSRPSRTSVLP